MDMVFGIWIIEAINKRTPVSHVHIDDWSFFDVCVCVGGVYRCKPALVAVAHYLMLGVILQACI